MTAGWWFSAPKDSGEPTALGTSVTHTSGGSFRNSAKGWGWWMSEKANSKYLPPPPGRLEVIMIMQSGQGLCGSPKRILRSRNSQTIPDLVG